MGLLSHEHSLPETWGVGSPEAETHTDFLVHPGGGEAQEQAEGLAASRTQPVDCLSCVHWESPYHYICSQPKQAEDSAEDVPSPMPSRY